MLNNRKTRLMTKLAIYEKRAGKEDIRLSKYYKTDYVGYNILKTVVAVTFGYLIILAMLVLYQSEYLIREAVNLNYYEIVKLGIGIYILILTVYIAASLLGYGDDGGGDGWKGGGSNETYIAICALTLRPKI